MHAVAWVIADLGKFRNTAEVTLCGDTRRGLKPPARFATVADAASDRPLQRPSQT